MELFRANKTRRFFVAGGLVAGCTAFVKGLFSSQSVSANFQSSGQQPAFDFLKISKDAINYLAQLDLNRQEISEALRKRYPNKLDQIEAKLNQDFWNDHYSKIIDGFHLEIVENLSEDDIKNIVAFYNTESGQKYLKYKTKIQGRQSHNFKALNAMHETVGEITRKLRDEV